MAEIIFNIIIYPILKLLEFSFTFAQKLFRETGISIIFIGVVVSVLCLPLYIVAERWQQIERDIVKKLKPKINKIKKVFKGDEQYMILSVYYRQNNYHPIYALRSSFGLLIQIPFFIAAFYFLSHLELLKGVQFTFIKDLGSPDSLLIIGKFSINILPIAMTLITCISSFIYTKGLSKIDKIQLYGMAAIFLILLYNSPSALVLYWTINNIFSLLKNIYYKVQSKYKFLMLLSFFSVCCIFLAAFLQIKFTNNSNAEKVFFLCVLLSFIPWVLFLNKNRIHDFFNRLIIYDKIKSFLVFLISILTIWSMFSLFIPSQLIVSSPQEYSFIDEYNNPLFYIFNTSLQSFGIIIFLPVCLYFLFSDNIKKYFSVVFLFFALGVIINVFLFPGDYGNISIDFIFSYGPDYSNKILLVNLCIMLIPIIAAFLLYIHRNKNIIIIPLSLCIISLLFISIINIFKINNAYNEMKKYYVKEQKNIIDISPIFTLSKNGKNIIVLMLDRAISVFIPYILEESPELKEIYSGFIYYPNTVSFNGHTLVGSVPVFGGYDYTPEEMDKRDDIPLVKKHNEALLLLPHIFSENNFSVCVTDPPYANYKIISDLSIYNSYPDVKAYITDAFYTDTWLKEHNIDIPKTSDVIKRNMFLYSLFKGLPLFLREPVYMQGDWFTPSSYHSFRVNINGYSVLDYLPRIIGITDEAINTALIMTNNTTHKNAYLLAPDYVPSLIINNYGNSIFSKLKEYHTTAAAIHRLGDWFKFLKNENLYNNTRIILVSDHSHGNFVNKTDLPFYIDQFNPLLMVKDFNTSGNLETDMTFMSNADVPYLSLLDVIENPVNPFTGNAISIDRKNKPLYIFTRHIPDRNIGNGTQFGLNPEYDYYVHENIFDPKNWTKASP